MNTITLLQPAEVKRDEDGLWYHPDLPTFEGSDEADESSPNWEEWKRQQGLEITWCALEDEPEDHPAYQAYWVEGSINISAWNPTWPDGEGWFLLEIGDTEDGPRAWFARRSVSEHGGEGL
jgi:hypothetical protein